MADDLDAELLALAGDSEEEQSPPPKSEQGSPAPSASSRSPDRDRSPSAMGRKGTAKVRKPRKPVKEDGEDGEMSVTPRRLIANTHLQESTIQIRSRVAPLPPVGSHV